MVGARVRGKRWRRHVRGRVVDALAKPGRRPRRSHTPADWRGSSGRGGT
jgi:hypothetical protein